MERSSSSTGCCLGGIGENLSRPNFSPNLMPSFLKNPIAGCIFLILIGCTRANAAAAPGYLEGHLKILSPRPVDLGDEDAASKMAETHPEYSLYPLVILSRPEKKQIAQLTADKDGNYRVALPPGDYVLDVQRHESGNLRAKPQAFTIVSNQIVRVDMSIETDHSRSSSMQSIRSE
jgi:hypothetical protein